MKSSYESTMTQESGKSSTLRESILARRTLPQNDLLWKLLRQLSAQLPWEVDGKVQRVSPEDFKDVLTAGLRQEQRWARGINGGLVGLGMHTSRMTKEELSDLIELIYAFGAQHGVEWDESPNSL